MAAGLIQGEHTQQWLGPDEKLGLSLEIECNWRLTVSELRAKHIAEHLKMKADFEVRRYLLCWGAQMVSHSEMVQKLP